MRFSAETSALSDLSSDTFGITFCDDDDVDAEVETDVAVTDGEAYRIVITKLSNDESNWEIWLNQSSQSVTVQRDAWSGNTFNFSSSVLLFAQWRRGVIEGNTEAIIDDFCLYGDSLTGLEVQSYRNPW